MARFPFQLIVAVVLLYMFFGWGFSAGLAIVLGSQVLNFYMAKWTQGFQTKVMKAKDIRMNRTTEALDNIKLIKFNSWIDRFIKFVNEARLMELKWLSKRFAMSVANASIINFTYPMLSLATYATSILAFGHDVPLSTAVAGLQIVQLL